MPEWVDILLRSLLLFVLVLVLVRIIGKKHPAKMTPFSFINYAVIAVIATLTSLKVVPNLALGLVSLAVWSLVPIASDYLALRSKVIHDLLHGKETILIKQGKIMEENLKQVRLSGEDLLKELRLKNAFNLADVEFAVLENTGDINVLLKSDKKPITAFDLGRKVNPQAESQTVILDGNVLNEPLSKMGLNSNWLKSQLESSGVSLDNVFIGQVNSSGELYLDLFDDSIQMPQPKIKELVYANLEKSLADLKIFCEEVETHNAKEMYSNNADKLEKLMQKLKPYLLR